MIYTAGKGQENFAGKLIHFGSKDFNNWQNVTQFFMNESFSK